MFDAIAGRYDLLNLVLSAGLDRLWRRQAIRSLQLTGTERVLDVCTGTADVAMGAASAVPGARRVVGVDFAGAMLHHGHDKVAAAGLSPRVQLIRGDATALPVADQSVDALTIAFGIRNVQVTARRAVKMLRVLRPGGRVASLNSGCPTCRASGTSTAGSSVACCRGSGAGVASRRRLLLPAGLGGGLSVWRGVCRDAGRGRPGRGHSRPLALGVVYLYNARRPDRDA